MGAVRWVCPTCGTGRLAPSRPRKNDVRRYCLPCSEKTGRLVERVAPSLERRREESRERQAAKTKAERARARARQQKAAAERLAREREKRTILGLNIDEEARRLWNLPVLRARPRWTPDVPPIKVRRSATKIHTSGFSSYNGSRIVLTIGSDEYEALGVLLHELLHPLVGRPGGQVHPPEFWRLLRSAAWEAWPDAPFRFDLPARSGFQQQEQVTLGLAGRAEQAGKSLADSPSNAGRAGAR